MNLFQKAYLFLFIFSNAGIIGNIELNIEIPILWKIIFIITGILTLGKIIYLETKGE